MAVFYCEICYMRIDLDFDVEHYENCPAANELEVIAEKAKDILESDV